MSDVNEKLFNKVLNYLSYRSRTKKELVDYLSKKKATDEESENIITRLDELGFIDDGDFVDQFISSRMKKGKGPKKIYFDLLNKGVEKDTINKKLSKIDDNQWLESALSVIKKKERLWGKLSHFKQKQKIYQLLYSWGYTNPTNKAVIDALAHQE
ncbi:regulatory protein RecX [Patescibacteria group bacterium]